jgi:hypothetical protein
MRTIGHSDATSFRVGVGACCSYAAPGHFICKSSPSIPPILSPGSCQGCHPRLPFFPQDYEYILPVSLLRPFTPTTGEAWDEDAAVAALLDVLRLYEGTHNFHNFTRIRARDIRLRYLRPLVDGRL